MQPRTTWRVLAALMCVIALIGSACSDDDDESTDANGSGTTTEETGDNAVAIELAEYGYTVDGTLTEGWTTFELANTGEEFHMIAFGRMRDGVDLDTVKTTLQNAFGGGEGGEGEGEEPAGDEPAGDGASDTNATDDHTLGDVQLISAQSDAETDTTEPEGEGEGDGEGGEEDPFAQLFHGEIEGPPGGFVGPGESLSYTVDGLDAGEYAMVCFLPTADGESDHLSEGMVGSFTVEEADEPVGEEPEADHEINIGDESVEVPTELPAGETTFKATFSGGEHELAFMEVLDDEATVDSLKSYFATFEETIPTKKDLVDAPAHLWGFSHSVSGDRTYYVTIDLTAGRWLIGDTLEEFGDDGEVVRDHADTETEFVTVT